MKDIDELLPRIMEVAPACPEPTAIRHARDAAIEFCRRTRIWRDHDKFELGEEACDVIAAGDEAQVFEITHASVTSADDSCIWDLEAKTVDWLDKNCPGWRDEEGTPQYITQINANSVRVTPTPPEGSMLRLELVLLPSNDADQLIDVLIDTYPQVIADGALGRVLALPTDFRQPDLAVLHGQAFERALDHWGDLVPRGQQRARRRTKPSTFF